MSSCNTRDSSWYVQVPLHDLLALQDSAKVLEEMRKENEQLKKRVEGLHQTFYQFMTRYNEDRKGVPTRRSA